MNAKRCTPLNRAVQIDAAPVRLDDHARDGQAQAAAAVPSARLVHLVEALEDAFGLLGSDVRAGVVHSQQRRARGPRIAASTGRWSTAFKAYCDGHAAGRGRVF